MPPKKTSMYSPENPAQPLQPPQRKSYKQPKQNDPELLKLCLDLRSYNLLLTHLKGRISQIKDTPLFEKYHSKHDLKMTLILEIWFITILFSTFRTFLVLFCRLRVTLRV